MEIDLNANDNIVAFPGVFKKEEIDAAILSAPLASCYHMEGYIFDDTLEHVKCNKCGEHVSPIFVLRQLAQQESRWRQHAARYQEELKRLAERSRTKCDHCGKMTRISHK